MATYYDDWTSREDVVSAYGDKVPPEAQIVYAGYTYQNYNGDALLVWRDEHGQWWENHDGHCSCYGLDNWGPEATSLEALKMRNHWPGLLEALESATSVTAVDPQVTDTGKPSTREEKDDENA
jgi:hypothetical protein